MKKNTFYKLVIAILLMLNILQIVPFFLKSEEKGYKKEPFKEKAMQILKLKEDQQSVFIELAKDHNDQMRDLFDEQKKVTTNYFSNPSDSLLNVIALIETKKIKVTNQHFSDVKNMLNNAQLQHFDAFKTNVLQVILKTKRDRKPPHKK